MEHTTKDDILTELKNVDMSLLNHADSQVRMEWARLSDNALGALSVWEDIENEEVLRTVLTSGKALLENPLLA